MNSEDSLSRRKFLKICAIGSALVPILGSRYMTLMGQDLTKLDVDKAEIELEKKLRSFSTVKLSVPTVDGYFVVPKSAVRYISVDKPNKGWVFKKHIIDNDIYYEVVPVLCKKNRNQILIITFANIPNPKRKLEVGDILYLDEDSFKIFTDVENIIALRNKCIP